jgi:hypothetical protein
MPRSTSDSDEASVYDTCPEDLTDDDDEAKTLIAAASHHMHAAHSFGRQKTAEASQRKTKKVGFSANIIDNIYEEKEAQAANLMDDVEKHRHIGAAQSVYARLFYSKGIDVFEPGTRRYACFMLNSSNSS